MFARVSYSADMWQEIKNDALFTERKFEGGKYPSSKWKKEMLLCEHSPIRTGRLIVELHEAPVFIIDHLVRHHIGFVPFVATYRDDRTSYIGGTVPDRETPNAVRFDGNFQAFINISRRRLCNKAHTKTIEAWKKVIEVIREVEPELADCMVPECIYRGYCYERKTCGFYKTKEYAEQLCEYRKILEERRKEEG